MQVSFPWTSASCGQGQYKHAGNLADHSRLQRLHTVCSGLRTTKVASVLHILLVDPEVMFQVLPSDLLGWLHSLHVHLNMSDQLTASTVYVCIKYDIQIRTCASCIQANCLCLHHQTGCGKDSLQHWRPLVPDQFVQLSAKHKY